MIGSGAQGHALDVFFEVLGRVLIEEQRAVDLLLFDPLGLYCVYQKHTHYARTAAQVPAAHTARGAAAS